MRKFIAFHKRTEDSKGKNNDFQSDISLYSNNTNDLRGLKN